MSLTVQKEPALRLRYDEPPSRVPPTEKEPFDYFHSKPSTQVPLRHPPSMLPSRQYTRHPEGAPALRERYRTPAKYDAETVIPSIEPQAALPISSRTRQQRERFQEAAHSSYYPSQPMTCAAAPNALNNPRDVYIDSEGSVRPAPAKRKSWPIQHIAEDPAVKRQRLDPRYEAIANGNPRRFHVTPSEMRTIDLTSSPQQLRRREKGDVDYPLIMDDAYSPRRPHDAAVPRAVKQVYVNELGRDPATGAHGYHLRPVEPILRGAAQPMPDYPPYAPRTGPTASAAPGSWVPNPGRTVDPPRGPHDHPPRGRQHPRRVSADDRSFTASRRRPAPAHPDGYVLPFGHWMQLTMNLGSHHLRPWPWTSITEAYAEAVFASLFSPYPYSH